MTDIANASEIAAGEKRSFRDIGFAGAIVAILAILFLPVPPFLLDFGFALSNCARTLTAT